MSIKKITYAIKNAPKNTLDIFMESIKMLQFILLVSGFFISKIIELPVKIPFIPKGIKQFFIDRSLQLYTFLSVISRKDKESLSRVDLIELAIKNMLFKKSRAVITIGGMVIGIGAIVFLVSVGFGIEKVVTSRVARLDELQQADVASQPGSNQKITDETLTKIKDIPNVEAVLPMIASVAKISYNNSVTDIPVYGVTKTYLSKSAIQPIQGSIYEQDSIALQLPVEDKNGSVAGVSTTKEAAFNLPIQQTTITNDSWLKIRENPSSKSMLVGFLQPANDLSVTKVWGAPYPDTSAGNAGEDENGNSLGIWYTATFPVWIQEGCQESQSECTNGYRKLLDDEGNQVTKIGYIANIKLIENSDEKVLGDTTDETLVLETMEGDVLGVTEDATVSAIPGLIQDAEGEWVAIASESAEKKAQQKELTSDASRHAVVNTAFLQVLGITTDTAVGTEFSTSFVIPSNLLSDTDEKIESVPTNYTIIGVVAGDSSPFFYVPFTDLRSLGVNVYSQAKVIAQDKKELSQIRKQIDALGFSSNSVADTVKQIEQLFASIRLILITLGLVALSVAALGMFNTLTVSLLERTREVGLMKAMGMRSAEVKELFLTESLIMGMIGGVGGICLGLGVGKLLSIGLSAFAFSKGAGTLDISYLPLSFTIFILLLSLFVGITTGLFPARRATKISALNALRYE